jgi:hypothetical protein
MIVTQACGATPWAATGLSPATPPNGTYRLVGQAKNPGPGAGFDDPDDWASPMEGTDYWGGQPDDLGEEPCDAAHMNGQPSEGTSAPEATPFTALPAGQPRGAAPFCRAPSFCGRRLGCVYKRGELGLGYYADHHTAGSVASSSGDVAGHGLVCTVTPAVLVLDELVGSGTVVGWPRPPQQQQRQQQQQVTPTPPPTHAPTRSSVCVVWCPCCG